MLLCSMKKKYKHKVAFVIERWLILLPLPGLMQTYKPSCAGLTCIIFCYYVNLVIYIKYLFFLCGTAYCQIFFLISFLVYA